MNLLFITEICPFPVHGGERLRTYGLLKIFSELNYNTLAIIGKTDDRIKLPVFKNIRFQEFNFGNITPESRWLRLYTIFRKNKLLSSFLSVQILNHKPDIVYIDYKYYGQYIEFFKKHDIPVIYGTHNVQSSMTRQLPVKTRINYITNPFRSYIHSLHEKIFFKKAGALICVSEDDKKYYSRFIHPDKIYVIPNFLVSEEYENFPVKKESYIVMSGNFNAYQNYKGLEWFIKNIWHAEEFKKLKLKLVGIGSQEALKRIKPEYTLRNIEALGKVEDLKPYIAKAKVSVVPILNGSGTRLKCIEAMALKTQILSTSVGAEGIMHNGSIVIADKPGEFKSKLLDILKGEIDYTQKAYEVFKSGYSDKHSQIIFKEIINNNIKNTKNI